MTDCVGRAPIVAVFRVGQVQYFKERRIWQDRRNKEIAKLEARGATIVPDKDLPATPR